MTFFLAEDIDIIRAVLKRHPNVTEAILFGSRAKGNHKISSDVDIAIKGSGLELSPPLISGELNDETPLPYTFDVVNYETLDNPDLKEHIQRVGISFYSNKLI